MNKLLILGVGAIGLLFASGMFKGGAEDQIISGGMSQTTSGAVFPNGEAKKTSPDSGVSNITYNINASSKFPDIISSPTKKTSSFTSSQIRGASQMTPISRMSDYQRVTGKKVSFLPAFSGSSIGSYVSSAKSYYSPYKSTGGFSSMY